MDFSKPPKVPKLRLKKYVRGLAEINTQLVNITNLFEQYLTEQAAHIMYGIIKEEWYDAFTPNNYERTYEFLNAVTILQSGTGWSVGVDGRKIHAYPWDGKTLPQHSDYNGNSEVSFLTGWINDVGIFTEMDASGVSGIQIREPLHYIEKTDMILKKNIQIYWKEFCIANNIPYKKLKI